MSSDFFNSSPILKQLRSKCIKNMQVKKSSIQDAGLGLFATKNIKAYTIISLYPIHTLGIEINEDDSNNGNDNGVDVQRRQLWVSNDKVNAKYFQENPPSASSYLHATDRPIFNRESIIGEEI